MRSSLRIRKRASFKTRRAKIFSKNLASEAALRKGRGLFYWWQRLASAIDETFGGYQTLRPAGPARRYSLSMSKGLHFRSPGAEFDPRLANELAKGLAPVPALRDEMHPSSPRRSPRDGYVRMLTEEGGILIAYKDQDRGVFLTLLRFFTWITATGVGGWLLFIESDVPVGRCLLALAALTVISWHIVRRPIEIFHTVEIRPDILIIDGTDVFYAEDIGENWPELQMKDDDPDCMVIAGICGTRFIEYMTANRLDENDRTPEVLAEDLEAAMEQLWSRREVTFAAAL
jgi:hypothetical protein